MREAEIGYWKLEKKNSTDWEGRGEEQQKESGR